MADVVVVGAGPIGLACAFAAQRAGADVAVLDDGAPGAWWHAAGMLAPVSEVEFGEEHLLADGLRSLELWPAFADELGLELREAGTLVVARDSDDAEALERLHAMHARLGLPATRLLSSAARRAEPALAPTVRLALDVPGDRAVDPRALIDALRARVPVRRERVTDLRHVKAGRVVVAAGLGTRALLPVALRPVKGQVLRLRDPRGPGLVERSIRTTDAYLVPRGDGRYVLGATMEERADTAPTAGGVYELVRSLAEVLPGVLELEIEEVSAGLRPVTPDNQPLVAERDGVIVATGHGRNGILLAPATAERVAALLLGVPA